jgi:hypothetical protein
VPVGAEAVQPDDAGLRVAEFDFYAVGDVQSGLSFYPSVTFDRSGDVNNERA